MHSFPRFFANLAFAAIGYYLAGRFGLLLAIPPGFASAVWPASGLALALALLRPGVATYFGIALGSLVNNLSVVSSLAELRLMQWMAPGFIALGAGAQAAAGAWLYRCMLGEVIAPDTPRAIARFVLVAAPLGCLIAASIGVGALLVSGIIPVENVAFSWLTWWVGDTIGVLLFAPLLMILCAPPSAWALSRKVHIVLPAAVMFVCITLLFFFSTHNRRQQVEASLAADSAGIFDQLQRQLARAEPSLRAYQALLQSRADLGWMQFALFAETLIGRQDDLRAVAWVPQLRAEERQTFVAATRAQGLHDYQLDEGNGAATARQLYPVQYFYPLEEAGTWLGRDLAGMPEGRAAMAHAARSLGLAAMPVLASGAHPRLFVLLPTFVPGEGLRGFIGGELQVTALLAPVMALAEQGHYGLALSDHSDREAPLPLLDAALNPLSGVSSRQVEFDFGGRSFVATLFAGEHYPLATKDWTSWSILTFGFLLAALFQALLLSLTGTNESIGREVVRKTQQLNAAKEAAEKASQAKTDFLANISHELRTPLNGVSGLIALCLKTELSHQQRDFLEKARLAANTLAALINQTLDFSKIGAGQIPIERKPFALQDTVLKMDAIFSHQARGKGLAFTLALPEDLPSLLLGDALRVEQVLLNLCGNAVKFTHRGEVLLHISVMQEAEEILWLRFDISDTGIGMSAEQQRQLFQPFTQADNSSTRVHGGAGLGLVICKNLVDLMGGSIRVESVLGQGTRVSVCLPFGVASQVVAEAARPDGALLHGHHVLLVDDISVNRDIVRFLLEDCGARVSCAGNGREALDALAAGDDIDLVLMDIQMPVMDGFQATAEIRAQARYQHLPIIAITANAMADDAAACRAAGMSDHIGKPLDEADLLRKIIRHLPRP